MHCIFVSSDNQSDKARLNLLPRESKRNSVVEWPVRNCSLISERASNIHRVSLVLRIVTTLPCKAFIVCELSSRFSSLRTKNFIPSRRNGYEQFINFSRFFFPPPKIINSNHKVCSAPATNKNIFVIFALELCFLDFSSLINSQQRLA